MTDKPLEATPSLNTLEGCKDYIRVLEHTQKIGYTTLIRERSLLDDALSAMLQCADQLTEGKPPGTVAKALDDVRTMIFRERVKTRVEADAI